MWSKIQATVFNPKVDQAALEMRLREIKERLPIPVFWLLGKAQSGKTAIIRAVTGDSRARIGDGIRPCTRTADVYEFPAPEDCFLKFLDTRGLGEIDYDPAEDIAAFQAQAHLLVVVMKAMDHAQGAVVDAVRTILARKPHWPLIVVQTNLHEGYTAPADGHIRPYPYDETPWPDSIPPDLARSLRHQRRLFKDLDARFVAVDFTLPEDGYEPVSNGSEALWQTIEVSLPEGVAAMIKEAKEARRELHDVYSKAAHPHVVAYALMAGAAGALPVPLMDIPLVTAIQAKMFQALASLYNFELDRQTFSEIGGALGIGFLVNLGRRQVTKLIPLYGAAISSLLTAATTYALGKTLGAYFSVVRKGGVPDAAILKATYSKEFGRGRRLLEDIFKTRTRKEAP